MEPSIKKDLQRFFEMLDYTEESDSGRIFNPVNISCVRAHMIAELDGILVRLREYARGN